MKLEAPSRFTPETHQRNDDKLARIPVKVEKPETPCVKKQPVPNSVNALTTVLPRS